MEEVWKDIKGFEGCYMVSNKGKIKSLNYNKKGYAKDLSLCYDKDGYQFVLLYSNGKRFKKIVHRLVAQTFIPNPHNKEHVNHINEIKDDNSVGNLEWLSLVENVRHGTGIERRSKTQSKTVYQYDYDFNLIKIWNSLRECGDGGYNKSHVCACCNGKRNNHKGFLWRYGEIAL